MVFIFILIIFIVFKEAKIRVFLNNFNYIYTFYRSYDLLVFKLILILFIIFKEAKICGFLIYFDSFLYLLSKVYLVGFLTYFNYILSFFRSYDFKFFNLF